MVAYHDQNIPRYTKTLGAFYNRQFFTKQYKAGIEHVV